MPLDGLTIGGRRRRGRRLGTALLVVLAVVGLAALAWLVLLRQTALRGPATPSDDELVARVAEQFLQAWEREDWTQLQALVSDQELDAAAVHEQAHEALRISEVDLRAGLPELDESATEATVPFAATWTLEGLGDHDYDGQLRLEKVQVAAATEASEPAVEVEPVWRVRWWYSTLHPDLTPEARFERVREFPVRAPILAADGTPLVTSSEGIRIGVQPQRVTDPQAIVDALSAHTDADTAAVEALLARDDLDPAGFYEVAAMAEEDFEAVRDELYPVPGLVFRNGGERTVVQPGIPGHLLGSVGEVTEEALADLDDHYRPGDLVGLSGLEAAFEEQLAGRPEEEARIVDDAGLVRSLAYSPGSEPEPLQTTLDPRIQVAAQGAVSSVAEPAALVVVDTTTGEVRASAVNPPSGFDRALAGSYPPGSTFKVVTATALLANGYTPATPLPCPPTASFGGRAFGNAGGFGPGTISFDEAMGRSCNTAFAQAATDVGADALVEAAESYGFNVEYSTGLSQLGGSFPEPADGAELAAAAIGQARVVASPVHMASVAAAAASGTWTAPHFVRGADVPSRHLPEDVVEPLTSMMRTVVASGTGTAANAGPDVIGKTGSAEYGSGDPPPTHAWFLGVRGDLAAAVIVEGGGGGGSVAAPVFARLLANLDG